MNLSPSSFCTVSRDFSTFCKPVRMISNKLFDIPNRIVVSSCVFASHHLRLPRESSQRQPWLEPFPPNNLPPVEPSSPATALNKPLGIKRLQTIHFPVLSTAPNNPFGIIRFRTLSRHNGGIGGCPTKNLKHHFNFPAAFANPILLSPFFSKFCAFFCASLHSAKTQPLLFQAIPHSLPKTPRGGVPPTLQLQRGKLPTLPIRPIAHRLPRCNNEQRHVLRPRPWETYCPQPVSKHIERTSGAAMARRRPRIRGLPRLGRGRAW